MTAVDGKRQKSKEPDSASPIEKLEDKVKDKALLDSERRILDQQIHVPSAKVTYLRLFRFATLVDKILVVIAAGFAIASGVALPTSTIVLGSLIQTFQKFTVGAIGPAEFTSDLRRLVLYFVYLAIAQFGAVYISNVLFIYTGEHISQKIRERYLKAVLRQNVGFFDALGAGEITTRITDDMNLVQDGLSEKVGFTLTAVATFFSGFVIGFIKSWKYTLILSSSFVAMALVGGLAASYLVRYRKHALESYAAAGSLAQEAIGAIRNVQALNSEAKLARRHATYLKDAERIGIKEKIGFGIVAGVVIGIIYLNYGLAFWQGSRFLVAGKLSISTIITVLESLIIGGFALGSVVPFSKAFTSAVAAASKIFNTIDRVSPLDVSTQDGLKLDHLEGTIELRGVTHAYPSRPEVTVLKDVDLVIPAGQITALVGASGSGKSTVVELLERFYSIVRGQIFIDGHDITTLNLRWLREHISLVGQEPVLFSTTIFNNIAFGLKGSQFENLSTEQKEKRVREAAQIALVDNFVRDLPRGYDTIVGERGVLLSGGQKQRIAIARAVVSNPKILLLDEATSALDTRSEGIVQAALDAASKDRTTLVIAHRLSTVRKADKIVVMRQGKIVEQGNHESLIRQRSTYYHMVTAQGLSAKPEVGGMSKDIDDATAVELAKEEKVDIPRVGSPDISNKTATRKRSTSGTKDADFGSQPASKSKRQDSLWQLIKWNSSFNKPETHWMLIGLFWSIIGGGGITTAAVFVAKSVGTLALPPSQYPQLRREANFWSAMFLMLAFVQLLAYGATATSFGYCSEKLVYRVRDGAFRKTLRQEIAFFDKEENSTGAVTSRISTQPTRLAGISGMTLGTILEAVTTLVSALAVGIAVGWKLGLVCTSTVPILLLCGFLRFYLIAAFSDRAKSAYEHSAGYACEAVSAIRTVASLTREEEIWTNYHQSLKGQTQKSLKSVLRLSSLYAASQSFVLLAVALGLWYGGVLIRAGEYNIFQTFLCFEAVLFGAESAGTIFSFAGDMGQARHAARELKNLFDSRPAIDSLSAEGAPLSETELDVQAEDLSFQYPTRPEQSVLRGLTFSVKPGQYIALVGSSGCGKSTAIQLILRFYDPVGGGVFVTGHNISSLNLPQYRAELALVSQDQALFQGTIRENVLMGLQDSDPQSSAADDNAIFEACKAANIYDFIISLPEGLDTHIGSKGLLLSGGQKQRVAIARALIRNPQILLLDEATSALDSEAEKAVQTALDAAARGRTTVSIAHRLSTIQNADVIYVLDAGKIVESGTHNELIQLNGLYAELVRLQSLASDDTR